MTKDIRKRYCVRVLSLKKKRERLLISRLECEKVCYLSRKIRTHRLLISWTNSLNVISVPYYNSMIEGNKNCKFDFANNEINVILAVQDRKRLLHHKQIDIKRLLS